MDYKILKDSELFSAENILRIEDKQNAVYVCETCLKGVGGGWINSPVAVFWNTDPANIPPGGSAWFGMFFKYDADSAETGKIGPLMITNAISAVENKITGVVAKNGDIIYSRYRHDYRLSPDGTAMVDGGRDYLRSGPLGIGTVDLAILDGLLTVVSELKVWNLDAPN